jgi:hypothetical protein
MIQGTSLHIPLAAFAASRDVTEGGVFSLYRNS